MRKSVLLIFIFQFIAFCFYAQPKQSGPLITINESKIAVGKVLEMITNQTGVNFSYNPQSINAEMIISFSVRKAPLKKVLSALGKKINAECSLVEDLVVITKPDDPDPVPEPEKYLTISGFISDKSSGESLIGATVSLAGTSQGVFTNDFGFYSLQVKPGRHTFRYSYIGYENQDTVLDITKNEKRNLLLETASIELPDITVGLSLKNLLDKKQLGELELSANDLVNMPEFGGESGLVKGLQSLPGVTMNSDGSAFFYVRGGERDQNLIIIDDAPIYNPSHLFGFYSLIIPDFTKSITIYKSDMPANLGDRLSSIVSIRTKDGNLNKLQFSGAINPLVNRFSLETPIVKKRGSIFVSFRRSNFGWLYKKTAPEANVNFSDFNFKWNHKINERNRLYFTWIWGYDNYSVRQVLGGGNFGIESGIRWSNFAATFRWNHIFGPKLFSNTTLYTGNYAYRLFVTSNFWQSGLGTISLKSDFTHYTSPKVGSKFGFEAQAYFINPSDLSFDEAINILPDINANYSRKLVGYYQGNFDLTHKLTLNAGLRITNWSNLGPDTYYTFDENYDVQDTIHSPKGVYHNYARLDPRLSLQYQLDDFSRIKISYGLYHQYLQQISNSASPFTTMEVWLPASPNIKPQASYQLALSYLRYFEKPKIEFSLALYHKKSKNQIDYAPQAVTLINPFIEGELRFGTMRSMGMEFLLKKELGRLNGWVGYTFSRTMRNTPSINEGRDYPAFQDRPHELSIMMNYELGKRVFFSGYWTMFSGARFSSPTGFYTFNDQTIPIYGEKNNDRLPAYHRLDVAFKFVLNKKEDARFRNSLTLSVYNATAHKNIVKVNFNKIPVDGSQPVVPINHFTETSLTASQADLIRFFPSLTYKFNL